MIRWDLMRHVLTGCVAGAMLAACGGSEPPISADNTGAITPSKTHYSIFHYTGSEQSFKVPAGVTHVTITADGAVGADGGSDSLYLNGDGGFGGNVQATIPVTPGERLAIFVGGSGYVGGFNGGAGPFRCFSGSHSCWNGGGGASDVRQAGDRLADRVVVAAGGGGGGEAGCTGKPSCSIDTGGYGGGGGGDAGGSGAKAYGRFAGGGGTGGTQSGGGKGGASGGHSCHGSKGRRGAGGSGADGCGNYGGVGRWRRRRLLWRWRRRWRWILQTPPGRRVRRWRRRRRRLIVRREHCDARTDHSPLQQ